MLQKHPGTPLPQKVLNLRFPKETKLRFEDRAVAHRGTKRDDTTRQDRVLLTFLGVLSAFIMVGILRLSLSGNLTAGNPPSEKKKKKESHCMDTHLSIAVLQLLAEGKKLQQEISSFLLPLSCLEGNCTRNVCVNDRFMTRRVTSGLCEALPVGVPYI